jgi:diadenosine tetraphosphate (Ap4A) HIT family hydrolase
VEHCVGPLGVGTLLVKPKRHVTRIAELTAREAEEQGPLLHRSAVVLDHLLEPAQTYVCLWSHADGKPVHIHYVVQPISRPLMAEFDLYGPWPSGRDVRPRRAAGRARRNRVRKESAGRVRPRSLKGGYETSSRREGTPCRFGFWEANRSAVSWQTARHARSGDQRLPVRGWRSMTVDFGRTASDYAAYRAGFPDEFFARLADMHVGTAGQRVVDMGTGTGRWPAVSRVVAVS